MPLQTHFGFLVSHISLANVIPVSWGNKLGLHFHAFNVRLPNYFVCTWITADPSHHPPMEMHFMRSLLSMKQRDTLGSTASLTSPQQQLSTSSRDGNPWLKTNLVAIPSSLCLLIKPKNLQVSILLFHISSPAVLFMKLTTGYSSSSNGMVERLHRTLFNIVRSMIQHSKVPTSFWAEALETANKIRNRLPSKSLNNISPHEAWFSTAPSIEHLRQFGCIAYARIPAKVITPVNKIAPRSIQCCFLGYVGNKIYRLWDPTSKRIVISRDVTFKENEFLPASAFVNIPQSTATFYFPLNDVLDDEDRDPQEFAIPIPPPHPQSLPVSPSPTTQSSVTTTSSNLSAPIPRPPFPDDSDSDFETEEIPLTPQPPTSSQEVSSVQHSSLHPSPQQPLPPSLEPIPSRPASPQLDMPIAPLREAEKAPHFSSNRPKKSTIPLPPSRRSERTRETSKRKKESDAGARLTMSIPTNSRSTSKHTPSYAPPTEPQTLSEALSSPQSDKWLEAVHQELHSLTKNGTWHLVYRPRGRKVIDTKFVFKLKDSETLNPRYKARLVAQGFSQIPGIDFTDTFAPVVKASSIRLLFALAAGLSLQAHQFDVETALLNPKIDQTIFVEQPPPRFNTHSQDYVLQLDKALNGLRQSPLLWSDDL